MKLIAYLSNGYPSLEESTKRGIDFVEAGVDVLEADLPSTDPYLDSPFLQKRIFAALDKEADYEKYMESLLSLRKKLPNTEFLVNIYVETLDQIGLERFISFMRDLKENQVLLVGDGYDNLRKGLEDAGLYASSYVTRQMRKEELELAQRANGFVYMQAFWNDDENSKEYPTIKACVKKVREIIGPDRQIYCGVGIHTPEKLREVYEAGADGAFLGSIVLEIEGYQDQLNCIKELRKVADGK